MFFNLLNFAAIHCIIIKELSVQAHVIFSQFEVLLFLCSTCLQGATNTWVGSIVIGILLLVVQVNISIL